MLYVIKGLLIAPFCAVLMGVLVLLGMLFGLSLIVGEPKFIENLVAVTIAVIEASFDEVNTVFCRFVFGENRES